MNNLKEINLDLFPNVKFGINVNIRANSIVIGNGVYIGSNVTIEASNIKLGINTIIENDTTIKSIGLTEVMSDFIIGDNCLIGHNTQILVPTFSMKDYSQLHNSALCSGYKPLTIGYNCWIGQGAILNSYEVLKIGNNVRMGGCQIWTHVASGELMEGSNFFGSDSVVIEDNVWLMGFGQMITPGVKLAKGTVVMAGSIITKDTIEGHTYSGIPAIDISEKLPAWKQMSIDKKMSLAKQILNEFIENFKNIGNNIHLLDSNTPNFINTLNKLLELEEYQVIIINKVDLEKYIETKHSIFDLTSKLYLKRRTSVEIDFIKFNVGYRARFIPYND